ncbi:hypothetical protein PENARI_c033G06413 [Penicillium arizonense]|uniref:IPT/TIG domain-containing protein n=1 Tax=Penicillium arizonense TaxID=1835702 RepID=A0A1F5L517_PENAI|nr:hypothetical protein PENARI_c033G06413 [Penicillium arizonense]OGE48070.1 hypothetical protein PENARI_c033G06413 [Penicillium arizonense]
MSAPTITRISPTSGPNSGGTTVLITGTNLATPTTVTFGGTAATVNSSTATSISVVSPAHAAGAARVVVTTAGGTSTQPVNFTYITVAAPVITSISPTSGPVSGGNTVTINGTNLQFTTGVTFGTTAASSFAVLSSTQVAAVAPAGTAGNSTVSVTNAAGTSGTIPYTYNGVAAPVANSVSPDTGPTAGGNTVVISGTGFTYASAVRFGLTPATSFTVVSSTVINAVVPPGGGAVNVFVTGPGGTSTGGPTYTYATDPAPTITGLTPAASGPVSGGNTVTIAGSNLNGATAVTFAGIAASSFTILSPTQITAVTPAGTAGTASVLVTTPAGTSTGFDYTYIAAPAPTAVVSSEGVAAGGNIVTITGTNLDGTTGVKFGTTTASFTVASDTEVDVVTPAHVVGMVPVSITTPGGTNNSLSFSFVPSPVIGSVTPASGPIGGDTVVTITGAGLINTLDVFFGTTAATAFTVISDNTVTATSPAGAAGTTALTVDTASATSNGAIFQYVDAPTLTSLSPTGGAIAGGNNVTLTGTGFLAATDVFFGANPTVFTILSDSSISAVAPSGVGAVEVTAVSPGGTSGAQTYTYS